MEASFWIWVSAVATKWAGFVWGCPRFIPEAVMAYSQQSWIVVFMDLGSEPKAVFLISKS